jgi:hypothetical protein
MSRSKNKEYLSCLLNGQLAPAHQNRDISNFRSSYIKIIIIIKLWRIQRTAHSGTHKWKLPRMRQLEDREEDGKNNIKIHTGKMCGRDSVLGIATSYRLHGLVFETPMGREACPTRQDRPMMRTQTPCTMSAGVLTGGKAVGAWRWPSSYSVYIKERLVISLPRTFLHGMLQGEFYVSLRGK